MHHFSFGVSDTEPELLAWLLEQKQSGWGELSRKIRAALKMHIEGRPPRWFEEWANGGMVVIQQPAVVEDKLDLGGLFDEE